MVQPEALYTFYTNENGIKEVRYKIKKNQLDDQYFYRNTNVEFHPHTENFEFMMDWLTAKYGEPRFTQIESYLDTYYFNEPRGEEYDYNVVLNVSNETKIEDFGSRLVQIDFRLGRSPWNFIFRRQERINILKYSIFDRFWKDKYTLKN